MDLDKSLDDLRPQRTSGRPRGGANRNPRLSRDRQGAEPYSRPPPRSTEDRWVHDAYDGPRGHGREPKQPLERRVPDLLISSPRIMVTGIHYEVTAEDLKMIFSQTGTIVQGPTISWSGTRAHLAYFADTFYDRSGRSTGNAVIEFQTPQEAKSAINKFDGAMTKGQTISIKLIVPPRKDSRPAEQRKTSGSLLGRLGGVGGGGSLQARIASDEQRNTPRGGGRGGRGSAPGAGAGPRGGARGGRGNDRGRGGRGGRPARAKPATAEDLDAELTAYAKPDASGDVEME